MPRGCKVYSYIYPNPHLLPRCDPPVTIQEHAITGLKQQARNVTLFRWQTYIEYRSKIGLAAQPYAAPVLLDDRPSQRES